MAESKKLPDKYYEKLDFMYTLLQKKLDGIDTAYTALGTKSGILFGFSSATLAFYMDLLFQNHLLKSVPTWLYFFRLSGVGGILLALIFLCLAIKTREFDDYPHQDVFLSNDPQEYYSGKTPFDVAYWRMKLQVLSDLQDSFNTNKNVLKSATKWFKRSIWLILGSVLLMIISSFIR